VVPRENDLSWLFPRCRYLRLFKEERSTYLRWLSDKLRFVNNYGKLFASTAVIWFFSRWSWLKLWHSLNHLGSSVRPTWLALIYLRADMSRFLYLLYLRWGASLLWRPTDTKALHTLSITGHSTFPALMIYALYLMLLTTAFYSLKERNYSRTLVKMLLFSMLTPAIFITSAGI